MRRCWDASQRRAGTDSCRDRSHIFMYSVHILYVTSQKTTRSTQTQQWWDSEPLNCSNSRTGTDPEGLKASPCLLICVSVLWVCLQMLNYIFRKTLYELYSTEIATTRLKWVWICWCAIGKTCLDSLGVQTQGTMAKKWPTLPLIDWCVVPSMVGLVRFRHED